MTCGNGRNGESSFLVSDDAAFWVLAIRVSSYLQADQPCPGQSTSRAFLYCETDDFDVTFFLMYKARIIEKARQELRKYIAAKQDQLVQARRLFSTDSRLNYRQREIVLHATRNPDRYFTIAEHQRQNGITYATAR